MLVYPFPADDSAIAESENGRVERWRGGLGFGIIPCRGFPVCVSLSTCRAPFPPPAHRTGRADFPHPALGQGSRFRPRVTAWEPVEAQQPKLAFETAVRVLANSLSIEFQFPPQPPTHPAVRVPMHYVKRGGVGSVAEVVGPPAQHLVDLVDQRFRPNERRQLAHQLVEPSTFLRDGCTPK
jgi:hypothetical protein